MDEINGKVSNIKIIVYILALYNIIWFLNWSQQWLIILYGTYRNNEISTYWLIQYATFEYSTNGQIDRISESIDNSFTK